MNKRDRWLADQISAALLTRRAQPEPESQGVKLIAVERQRQVAIEGWTAEHDDTHLEGEMIEGARSYLSAAFVAERGREWNGEPPPLWPWNQSWWKPSKYPVQNLMKAGALIAAEIDRLLRSTQCVLAAPPVAAKEPTE